MDQKSKTNIISRPAFLTSILAMRSYPWLVVALLCVVGCLNYIDRTMITTMRSSILEEIPMSDTQFGLLTSVFLWVYGLLSPFAGYLADRFNRSRVIIVSLFVWSLVTWLTVHVTSFEQLLFTRALMGISEACYIPAALALITDYHRGSTRSMATGIHMAGIMAGQSLGFIGGWIAEKYYWTLAFGIFGVFGIIYSFILLFTLKDAPKENRADSNARPGGVAFIDGIKTLFKTRSYYLLIIFWSLLSIISWMIVGWLPTFYKELFNLSQSVAGLYATGFLHPASIIGVLLGGFLADKWSKTNERGRIYIPVIGLCIAAPCIFLAGNTSILPVAIICFVLYALTKSFSDVNMMPILCLVADPRYRATGYGVLNLFSCIIGGLGLFAGGALRDSHISLSTIFQFSVVLIIICIFLLLKVKTNTFSNPIKK